MKNFKANPRLPNPKFMACALTVVMAGCVGGNYLSNADTRAGLICVDDSNTCIKRRQQALHHLRSNPDRSWIRERATPQTYAAGVRMFALKAKKNDLTCDELKLGKLEAERAPLVLISAPAKNLTPAQISRGKMLAFETASDLKREIKRRCR